MYRRMGFGDFLGDDPFFGPTLRHMDNMMNSIMNDPLGMMGGMGPMNNFFRHNPTQAVSPFNGDPFANMLPFPNINSMFPDMRSIANDPNAHSFSSSTVMTMVNGPDGRPQVYQASSSTRSAPGGVKETKNSVVDTRSGTKKMAIGHHIGERAHIMEREQNTSTGEIEGRDNLINLDLDDKDDFEVEWQEKTRTSNALYNGRQRDRAAIHNSRSALPSLPPAGSSHSSTTTANLRAKARAAVAARRKARGQSCSTRVEITEITDEDDSALTNSPSESNSPIIEYPSHSQSHHDHGHDHHDHHDHARRLRSRESRDREREGSRKRDFSDETEEYRHKYKSRRSELH